MAAPPCFHPWVRRCGCTLCCPKEAAGSWRIAARVFCTYPLASAAANRVLIEFLPPRVSILGCPVPAGPARLPSQSPSGWKKMRRMTKETTLDSSPSTKNTLKKLFSRCVKTVHAHACSLARHARAGRTAPVLARERSLRTLCLASSSSIPPAPPLTENVGFLHERKRCFPGAEPGDGVHEAGRDPPGRRDAPGAGLPARDDAGRACKEGASYCLPLLLQSPNACHRARNRPFAVSLRPPA